MRTIIVWVAVIWTIIATDARAAEFLVDGGRNDLSPNGQWVYFDRVTREEPFHMEIFRVHMDGTREQCLTCGLRLPAVIGQPLAHPAGRQLLFQGLTHSAPLKARSPYYHPSWGFNNDFYVLDLETRATSLVLDCSELLGEGFGNACLHPQFSPDGKKLLFASRERHGIVNPWQWWTPMIADFDARTRRVSRTKAIFPRRREAFYETHQILDDGSFIYSFGPGAYPQGTYRYTPGKGPKPIYASMVGDWVEHAHVFPDGRVVLNTSRGLWNPRDGVKALRMELHELRDGRPIARTDFGAVTSDFSCHGSSCVVQVADLGDSRAQPRLFIVHLER
jgi:hypothetical protein